jgi:hypothetical protein
MGGSSDDEFSNPVAESGMFESERTGDPADERKPDSANPDDWGDLGLGGIVRGDVDEFILNWCKNACASSWLDATILICIIFNTFLLAYAGPANTYSEDVLTAMMIADLVLTLIFSIEMFIRIIALGFYDRTGELPVPRYMNECAATVPPLVCCCCS